jgi:hypothetical protein
MRPVLEEAVVQPAVGWIDDAGANAWDGPATAGRTVTLDPARLIR